MKTSVASFCHFCKKNGFDFYTGTPCSYLKPLINYIIDDPEMTYFPAPNEGDAVAMAAAASLSGSKAVVMFQNSGLGNGVNALTSLCYPFKIPLLLIVTHRGQPGREKDEPQHEQMGQITHELLNLMGIPSVSFPKTEEESQTLFFNINRHFEEKQLPYAIVMSKGDTDDYELKTVVSSSPDLPYRNEVLKLLLEQINHPKDLFVATTGYTSRELYAINDRANHLYMVGSMGSASSFAVGLALKSPDRRVIVLDGDSAILMRMGNLVLPGNYHLQSYLHIVLDNGANESTGGQSSLSGGVDFCKLALGAGFKMVESVSSLTELSHVLREWGVASDAQSQILKMGPYFLHIRIRQGVNQKLPRPNMTPVEVAKRFSHCILND